MPLIKNVLQAIVCLCLGPFNQVSNLKTFIAKLTDTVVVLNQNFTFSLLKLLQVTLLLGQESVLFAGLCIDGLSQNSFLFVELLELICKLFLLSLAFLRFVDTDTIVLGNRIQFGHATLQLIQLFDLLTPQLFSLHIFVLQLRKFLSEVSQALSCILHLL